jgi:hypothetical protein
MNEIPLPLTGGCQCGAVRYEIARRPVKVHYCHCRMCQKAVGNVFAALAPVKRKHVQWTSSPPSFFASSSVAKRGFCPACGTPLTFAYDASEWICMTIGSLDRPDLVPPEMHVGVESQVPWLKLDDALPHEATETGPNSPVHGMASHQK